MIIKKNKIISTIGVLFGGNSINDLFCKQFFSCLQEAFGSCWLKHKDILVDISNVSGNRFFYNSLDKVNVYSTSLLICNRHIPITINWTYGIVKKCYLPTSELIIDSQLFNLWIFGIEVSEVERIIKNRNYYEPKYFRTNHPENSWASEIYWNLLDNDIDPLVTIEASVKVSEIFENNLRENYPNYIDEIKSELKIVHRDESSYNLSNPNEIVFYFYHTRFSQSFRLVGNEYNNKRIIIFLLADAQKTYLGLKSFSYLELNYEFNSSGFEIASANIIFFLQRDGKIEDLKQNLNTFVNAFNSSDKEESQGLIHNITWISKVSEQEIRARIDFGSISEIGFENFLLFLNSQPINRIELR